jgi:hypothetical protein
VTDYLPKVRRKKISLFLAFFLIGICLVNCSGSTLTDRYQPDVETSMTPVFLFTQASPNGKTVEAVVPSDLVDRQGSLEKLVKTLPANSKFAVQQFGKHIAEFQTNAIATSNDFGALAIFKLSEALTVDSPLWQEPNLVIVPSHFKEKQSDRPNRESDRFNCPSKVQPFALHMSRPLFARLGIQASRLEQIALASFVCLDIDRDDRPEIVAGLRLDNPDRPTGMDRQEWLQFLSKPPMERQEYSMLVLLRQPTDAKKEWQAKEGQATTDWIVESIITHTRALSYPGDSISSYVLFGALDLNGDRLAELIVQEIGLVTIDALVVSPRSDWRWHSYYGDRPLTIVQ